MKCIWSVYEVYMKCIWSVYEVYMKCIWSVYEVYMKCIWSVYEVYMKCIWSVYEVYMQCICSVYEVYMQCIWSVYEVYMKCIWSVYEVYMNCMNLRFSCLRCASGALFIRHPGSFRGWWLRFLWWFWCNLTIHTSRSHVPVHCCACTYSIRCCQSSPFILLHLIWSPNSEFFKFAIKIDSASTLDHSGWCWTFEC